MQDLPRRHATQFVISGTWHLLHEAGNEVDIPDHRMDLRFRAEPGRLYAAVLSRTSGEELVASHASFDGDVLRFQARISDMAVVPYRQDQAPRLDFWGSDIRNHTTEGDTLWVNYTTSHFSSRSMVS